MPTSRASEHADVVVVGSGFGGSVAAYRLADAAGPSCCWSAAGPTRRAPSPARRPRWAATSGTPARDATGSSTSGPSAASRASCPAGSAAGRSSTPTSCCARTRSGSSTSRRCPAAATRTGRSTRADLDPHYDRVEQMLGATPLSRTPTRRKTAAMRDGRRGESGSTGSCRRSRSASRGGRRAAGAGAPIPTPAYGNVHGLPRLTCRLCGECDIGCNDGAKNTLDHTYLSAARHHGADLRTRYEVRGLPAAATGGGYEVRTSCTTRPTRSRRPAWPPLHRSPATGWCSAAGTFGTTYLLLRNRTAFPGLSRDPRHAGSAATATCWPSCSTRRPRTGRPRDGRGQPRTGDHQRDPGRRRARRRRFDAGAATTSRTPATRSSPTGWSRPPSCPARSRRAVRFARSRLPRAASAGRRRPASRRGPRRAARRRRSCPTGSLPLLGMGRDVPDGVMQLHKGHLEVDWTTDDVGGLLRAGPRHHAGPAPTTSARVTRTTRCGGPGGWSRCTRSAALPWAGTSREGVCDENGEVFGFPGLHVLDGSLLPGPVGANPSLTIAAVADRGLRPMLIEHGSPARTSARRDHAARRPVACHAGCTGGGPPVTRRAVVHRGDEGLRRRSTPTDPHGGPSSAASSASG